MKHRDSLTIEELAEHQLSAYNHANLEGFCACYHDDVVVLDADGAVILKGIVAFRSRYAPMFARGGFGADVSERLVMGDHCVDFEQYWREDPNGGKLVRGKLLVRYHRREGLIGLVQFLR